MSRSFRAIGARARHPAARTLLIAGSATVGAGLLLAACSGATLNSAGRAAPHRAIRAAGTPGFAAAGQGSAATGKTAGRARLALSTQSIIYTADLTLRVDDVAAQAEAAKNIVTAVGGYVAREQEITPPGRHRTSVQLALKIPVAQYAQTLDKLKALHGKQIAFNQHAVDVTQRVADVNSRVASAQAAISQLRALLRRAGSVSQLLPVQEQINSQESELEALLAQQRALAHETSYATVTVLLLGHHAVILGADRARVDPPVRGSVGAHRRPRLREPAQAGAAEAAARRRPAGGARGVTGGPGRQRADPAGVACTRSVSLASMSGSVSGSTPWPRLKM